MYNEYIYILKYFLFALFISCLLFMISFFFVYQVMDKEKISSYECGFSPFGDSRMKFEIRFYIVGILFIIFDLEIIFLFPWLFIIMENMSFINGYGMFLFIFILLLGFIYEIINGALDWE